MNADNVDEETQYRVTFSNRDELFLNLVTKYFLLAVICNGWTVIALIYWAIAASQAYLAFTFWSIDNLINIVSLYLQYPFGEREYKLICVCCHKWIKSRMTLSTLARVRNIRGSIFVGKPPPQSPTIEHNVASITPTSDDEVDL